MMMLERLGQVETLLQGRTQLQPAIGEPSAIVKTPVIGSVWVGVTGLVGDEQGDLRVHGGAEKAIHCYPIEHYAYWRTLLGAHPLLGAPGAFGENFSTRGLHEASLCIGDRLRIGSIEAVVSQGRQPCYKLSRHFGVADLAVQVQSSLKTGWYLRVLQEGPVAAGAAIELLQRPWPEWTIQRVMALLYTPCLDAEVLSSALALPLGASWRRTLERRLSSGCVEDWRERLYGA